MTFSRAAACAGFALVASFTAWEIRHPAVATSFESVPPALASVTMDRLPSAIGALLALLALAELVARTVSSRAALVAVGVYMTMPLAFVPARLRSGGELLVGVITLAVAALMIAALDTAAARTTRAVFALAGASLAAGAVMLVVKARRRRGACRSRSRALRPAGARSRGRSRRWCRCWRTGSDRGCWWRPWRW